MWSGNPSQEEARQSRPFSQDSAKKLLRTENRHIRNASIRLDDAMLAVAHNSLHTLHPSTRRRVISHFFFERSITPYFLTSAWIFTRLEKFSGTISHPLLDMPYSLSIIETLPPKHHAPVLNVSSLVVKSNSGRSSCKLSIIFFIVF